MKGRLIATLILSYRIVALASLLVLSLPSQYAHADMRYTSDLLAYTSDKHGFAEGELQPLFDRLLHDNKPLVIFIHGRGDEPSKSLEGTNAFFSFFGFEGLAVQKITAYDVNVVMVSWDSRAASRNDRERPLANMPEAQGRLAKVLDAFARASDATVSHVPVTLLAHSMGTIVLEKYVKEHGWQLRGITPLFSHVVLSSSDADDKEHDKWLQIIASVERVLVTINPDDGILGKSAKQRREIAGSRPLGRDPRESFARDATYIHIPPIGAHEIFERQPRGARGRITTFFDAIFHGNDPQRGRQLAGVGHHFELP